MNFLRYANVSNVPLSGNQAFRLSQAHALMHYRSNSVYSFIPKNACSTLRYSLAIANGCLEHGGDINWIHANNATFSASLHEAITANYTFVVVRCPLRRLASVFLDKILGKEAPTAWVYYDLIGRERSLDEVTFEYFVDSLIENKILHREIHWRPQVDFLLYKRYSDVFSVEEFSRAVVVLKEKIKFDVYDARNLTKHGSEQYSALSDGLWHNVPIKELYQLKMNGQLPTAQALYSNRVYSLARKAYAQDIELYSQWCDRSKLLCLE